MFYGIHFLVAKDFLFFTFMCIREKILIHTFDFLVVYVKHNLAMPNLTVYIFVFQDGVALPTTEKTLSFGGEVCLMILMTVILNEIHD